jgi:hypothetical protein
MMEQHLIRDAAAIPAVLAHTTLAAGPAEEANLRFLSAALRT